MFCIIKGNVSYYGSANGSRNLKRAVIERPNLTVTVTVLETVYVRTACREASSELCFSNALWTVPHDLLRQCVIMCSSRKYSYPYPHGGHFCFRPLTPRRACHIPPPARICVIFQLGWFPPGKNISLNNLFALYNVKDNFSFPLRIFIALRGGRG